jgi:hypothetical protein
MTDSCKGKDDVKCSQNTAWKAMENLWAASMQEKGRCLEEKENRGYHGDTGSYLIIGYASGVLLVGRG